MPILGINIPARSHPVMTKPKQGPGKGRVEGAICNGFGLVYNALVPVCPGTEIGRGDTMKSFWIGSMAAVIIAIVAGVVLSSAEVSTAEKYSTADTRR